MIPRIGIIADDLTGANDTAVQFVRAGWETELQLRSVPTSSRVIAVSTDSRNQTAAEAAEAVTVAVARVRKIGVTHLYKKIDSTLRGQVRAEIDAVLESWLRGAIAIVCPAFPAAGRAVIGGELRVNGVPVTETTAANDPIAPVTEARIQKMLGATLIASGSSETAIALAARIKTSGRIVVVDATGEDDLRRLAAAVALVGPAAIAVGSAGLARHLAFAWRPTAAPAVVIVTSIQDVARRQASAVETDGAYRVEPAPDEFVDEQSWARISAAILTHLEENNSTVLLTAPVDRSRGLPPTLIPKRFAELTARMFVHRPRGSISGVVVTGGDGARALVEALDATAINLRDEVVTGMPIGTLVGGLASGLTVVTKAGGFGDDGALVQAVESVRYRRFA